MQAWKFWDPTYPGKCITIIKLIKELYILSLEIRTITYTVVHIMWF